MASGRKRIVRKRSTPPKPSHDASDIALSAPVPGAPADAMDGEAPAPTWIVPATTRVHATALGRPARLRDARVTVRRPDVSRVDAHDGMDQACP